MKTFIVTLKVRGGTALLGEGVTSVDAFDDAFGQPPWTQRTRSEVSGSEVREVEVSELERLRPTFVRRSNL